jgi:hypothetical protein
MANEPPSISPAVIAMADDPTAPTAPLTDFLAAMAIDDNWWWRIASGHHLNLFEAAVELLPVCVICGAPGRILCELHR